MGEDKKQVEEALQASGMSEAHRDAAEIARLKQENEQLEADFELLHQEFLKQGKQLSIMGTSLRAAELENEALDDIFLLNKRSRAQWEEKPTPEEEEMKHAMEGSTVTREGLVMPESFISTRRRLRREVSALAASKEEERRKFAEAIERLERDNDDVTIHFQQDISSLESTAEELLSEAKINYTALQDELQINKEKIAKLEQAKKEALETKNDQDQKETIENLTKIQFDIDQLTLENIRKLEQANRDNYQLRQDLEHVGKELTLNKKQHIQQQERFAEHLRNRYQQEVLELTQALEKAEDARDKAQEESLAQAMKLAEQKDWMEESQTLIQEVSRLKTLHAQYTETTGLEMRKLESSLLDSQHKNQQLIAETQQFSKINASLHAELASSQQHAQDAHREVSILKQQIQDVQSTAHSDIARLEAEKAEANRNWTAAIASEEQFEKQIRALESEVQTLQGEKKENTETIQILEDRIGEESLKSLTVIHGIREELAREQEKFRGIKELFESNKTRTQAEHAELQAENRRLEAQLSDLAKTSSSRTVEIRELTAKLQTSEQALAELNQHVQIERRANEHLLAETHSLAQKNNTLEHQFANSQVELRNTERANQALDARIQQSHQELRSKEAEIDKLQHQIFKDKDTITVLHTHISSVDEEQQETQKTITALQSELRTKTRAASELEHTNQQLRELNIANGKDYKKQMEDMQRNHARALEEANSRATHAQRQAENATREVHRLQGVQSENETILRTLEALRQEQQRYQEALRRKDNDIAELRAQIRESQQAEQLTQVNSAMQAERDRKTIEDLRSELLATQFALTEAQNALRQRVPAAQPPGPLAPPLPQPIIAAGAPPQAPIPQAAGSSMQAIADQKAAARIARLQQKR